jgi:autotransporter passenger strand-loop-strand repeat protein
VVSGTTVSSGGEEYVASGGTAIGAKLKGGYDVVFGSAVSATVSSGTQYVFGVATATTVSSGGMQVVESSASASGTVVSSGGQDYIVSGGLASGARILSGGIETVFGTASGTTLSGGVQYDYRVAVGGTALGAGHDIFLAAARGREPARQRTGFHDLLGAGAQPPFPNVKHGLV